MEKPPGAGVGRASALGCGRGRRGTSDPGSDPVHVPKNNQTVKLVHIPDGNIEAGVLGVLSHEKHSPG